ncbi:FecR domain-containing protein [Flammeovirga yaeyamensis]|uniref:FecR domain-containing protein n=1 Tax=Flammeovirga yaeyamensis TaxID=367791 RepID=A0AAX1N535_9BACT|nr:FecR domain-containing protein [Flammeovirga yaeyamensis]MBB3701324.1 ferric-dicitrate binding protein FerR (iron transport regulator) [Flammeovirga yaeyamensis]NMF38207.1 DUF4974 domain-containing protein [Flammeovirga yaeyamensis]QWG02620.1 FecR domain-containing protein [Flammeovirga yaeyamensis]
MDKLENIDWTLIAKCLGGDEQAVLKAKEVASSDEGFKSVLSEVTEIWTMSGSMGQNLRNKPASEVLDKKVNEIWSKVLETESEELSLATSLASNKGVDSELQGIWDTAFSLGQKQKKEVSNQEMDAAMAKMLLRMNVDEQNSKEKVEFKVEKNVPSKTKERTLWNFQTKMAMAVAMVLAVGFSLFNYFDGGSDLQTFASGTTVAKVDLPDGTQVWLSPNSEITYPSEFAENRRQVQLNGEAFFEVHHNKEKPFSILTNDTKTTVLGTSFYLKADEVEVVTGKVRYEDKSTGDYVVLVKDEKGVLNQEGISKVAYDSQDALKLRQANIVFQGSSLEEVVEELSIAYGKEIVIESDELKSRKFTGTFKNKSFSTVIAQVSEVIGCETQEENNKVILK